MMKGQKGYVLVRRVQTHDSRVARLYEVLRQHVRRWYDLHRQRALLAQLDDNALKDLGLTRADVYAEVERPFWDDPMKH
jgi:uncharacterized protein YjiS (DUF1127 family)